MTAGGTPGDGAAAAPAPWPAAAGAWDYPYAPVGGSPAHPGAAFVTPEELAPVLPPQQLAPAPVRDPRRTTLAAVLTFLSLLVGLWAILGFLGSMSNTLSSLASGNEQLRGRLQQANEGLAGLDTKTARLKQMGTQSAELRKLLDGIDANMATMLEGVGTIDGSMGTMRGSLATLDDDLAVLNTANVKVGSDLETINTAVASQRRQVARLRSDIVATRGVVRSLPGRLAATNGRLGHINSVVNQMGCRGIASNIDIDVSFTFVPAGSARILAVIVPPGAWGMTAKGTPC